MNKQIIQKLVKLANQLDAKGFYKEAKDVDELMSLMQERQKKQRQDRQDYVRQQDKYQDREGPKLTSVRELGSLSRREILMSPIYLNNNLGSRPPWDVIEKIELIAKDAKMGLGDAKKKVKLLFQQPGVVAMDLKFVDDVENVTEAYFKRRKRINDELSGKNKKSPSSGLPDLSRPTRKKKKSKNRTKKSKRPRDAALIQKLTKLANQLDKKGFHKEADEVDRITEKLDGNDKKLKRGRAQQLKSPMKEIIAFLIEEGYDGPEIDLPWDGGQITVFAGKDDHRIREVELKFIPGGEYVDYDHVAVEIHEWPSSTYKGPPVRGYVKNLEDFKKLYSKPEEYGWKTSAQRYQERMERIRKERESWQKNKRSWCPRCKGEGYAGPYGDTCSHCEGSGTDPRLDYTDEEVDRLKSRGNKQTIQKLARLANELDKKGFYKEADEIDRIVVRAQRFITVKEKKDALDEAIGFVRQYFSKATFKILRESRSKSMEDYVRVNEWCKILGEYLDDKVEYENDMTSMIYKFLHIINNKIPSQYRDPNSSILDSADMDKKSKLTIIILRTMVEAGKNLIKSEKYKDEMTRLRAKIGPGPTPYSDSLWDV